MVFCNMKNTVRRLGDKLRRMGRSADALHGDIPQAQRNRVMNGFREGKFEVLVATDVAARGIDVDDVEAVFNYDIPDENEYYLHRIGRTGRAKRHGVAFTFLTPRRPLPHPGYQKIYPFGYPGRIVRSKRPSGSG